MYGDSQNRQPFCYHKCKITNCRDAKARFRRRSTHVPNLTEELSTAKERRLNQFGTAVLICCDENVRFDRVCRIIKHWSGR